MFPGASRASRRESPGLSTPKDLNDTCAGCSGYGYHGNPPCSSWEPSFKTPGVVGSSRFAQLVLHLQVVMRTLERRKIVISKYYSVLVACST